VPIGAHLRPAVPADCASITALIDRAYAHYVPRMGRKPGPMLADHAAEIAAGETQVLQEEGRIVGVLVLRNEPEALLLDDVAVDPDCKGKGYGRLLLEEAERQALARGYSAIRLYTHVTMVENIALYTRIGYFETARGTERGFERVFMVKQLR